MEEEKVKDEKNDGIWCTINAMMFCINSNMMWCDMRTQYSVCSIQYITHLDRLHGSGNQRHELPRGRYIAAESLHAVQSSGGVIGGGEVHVWAAVQVAKCLH